jgi:hypothetical protein
MPTRTNLIGDELLVTVFAQFPEKSTFRVADESDIVGAFFKAKQTGRFKHFFRNYAFDTDGTEPTSRSLSEALDSLQQSRLLGRMNPDLVDYSISPALKIRFERFLRDKVAGKESLVKKLANYISGELGVRAGKQDHHAAVA